jgi:hypothetical protein
MNVRDEISNFFLKPVKPILQSVKRLIVLFVVVIIIRASIQAVRDSLLSLWVSLMMRGARNTRGF